MTKFNLEDYLSEIRAVGLDKFIVNLAVMKEQNPGAPKLNFHELGQAWNKLPSDERLAQREKVAHMMNRSSRVSKEV
nr:MAG TPA: hypothetical protein [Caudoviricetes sp.]